MFTYTETPASGTIDVSHLLKCAMQDSTAEASAGSNIDISSPVFRSLVPIADRRGATDPISFGDLHSRKCCLLHYKVAMNPNPNYTNSFGFSSNAVNSLVFGTAPPTLGYRLNADGEWLSTKLYQVTVNPVLKRLYMRWYGKEYVGETLDLYIYVNGLSDTVTITNLTEYMSNETNGTVSLSSRTPLVEALATEGADVFLGFKFRDH